MTFIINTLAPIAFKLLDIWLQKNAKDKEMINSYYEFLRQVDKSGAAKVANYLAAEDALKKKQDELKKELEQ